MVTKKQVTYGAGGLITVLLLISLLPEAPPSVMVNLSMVSNTPQCLNCELILRVCANDTVDLTVDWLD